MDINVFKFSSGLKVLGYFMILLVAGIIAVSYYAVVVLTWGPQLLRGGVHSFLAFSILILFHFLLMLLSWSYFMVVFRDPGSVPENWRPPAEEENLEAGSSMQQMSDHVVPEALALDGLERKQTSYCSRCQNGKPPRCHHCSVCHRCVLKMDHHCVWVVNCVGACNYKFFLLFLDGKAHKNLNPDDWILTLSTWPPLHIISYTEQLYTFLETTLDTLALLPSFIEFFTEAKNHSSSPGSLAITFLAFVLNLAFALSLLCFVIMHASLVSSNTTSVEVYEKKKAVRWRYDVGKKRNFEQVFGTKKALWLLPMYSKNDLDNIPALQGLEFPTRSNVEA